DDPLFVETEAGKVGPVFAARSRIGEQRRELIESPCSRRIASRGYSHTDGGGVCAGIRRDREYPAVIEGVVEEFGVERVYPQTGPEGRQRNGADGRPGTVLNADLGVQRRHDVARPHRAVRVWGNGGVVVHQGLEIGVQREDAELTLRV